MSEQGIIEALVSAVSPPNVARDGVGRAEVGDDDLAVLLGAARLAPSADNAQIWRFVTVRDPETRERLGEAAKEELRGAFSDARVVIVACGVRFVVTRTRREQPFSMIDVPIAFLHLLLQAEELGLRYSWTLDFDEEAVGEALELPEGTRVVALIAL